MASPKQGEMLVYGFIRDAYNAENLFMDIESKIYKAVHSFYIHCNLEIILEVFRHWKYNPTECRFDKIEKTNEKDQIEYDPDELKIMAVNDHQNDTQQSMTLPIICH